MQGLIQAQIKGHIGGPNRACIRSDDDVLVAVSDGPPWLAGYGEVYAGTFFCSSCQCGDVGGCVLFLLPIVIGMLFNVMALC